MSPPILVLGTRNKKKLAELIELLEPKGIAVYSLASFPPIAEVVEDQDTFFGNAEKKAAQQALELGHWTLGEDSGLCVDALKGAPGVYSARYAGEPCDDAANNRKLLEALAGVPLANRGAYYICTTALADPQGEIVARAEGRCRGRMIDVARGEHGFGYDPLFEIEEYHRTFGELGPAIKRALSHRSRALAAMIPQIVKHMG